MNTFNKDRLYAENEDLKERITELEDLAQSIIDAQYADHYPRMLMYYSWLHRAKKLKGGDLWS